VRPAAVVALAIAATVLFAAGLAQAKKKAAELFWTRPDYATLHVDRIAMLPVTSYDNDLANENLVEATLGPAFRTTGYRWISGSSTREMLRARTGGDSLLKVLRAGVLAQGRLDSLQAPALAALLRCDAVLTVRVDLMERHEPEWNVAGKPYTDVRLSAALVDSAGRLLWIATGGQAGEGAYYDPAANPVGVSNSGLDRKPMSGQGGAPQFREVLPTLFARWAPEFPPHAAAPDSSARQ